jgi:hypothetical protein
MMLIEDLLVSLIKSHMLTAWGLCSTSTVLLLA